MITPYDQIELFGLTENGTDDLPIPMDDELQGRAVGDAFEALLGTIQGTGLASEVEPLAHAFATMFQRRAVSLDQAADRLKMKIRAVIEAQDGSEIVENQLDEAQRLFNATWEKSLALKLMAETAAEAYERETGEHYVPVTGDRTTKRAMETGAVFEAKKLLEAADREEAERNKVTGTFIAVAGASDWIDSAPIWRRLDAALVKCLDMVLCHKGSRGAERIAASWAKSRKVTQVLFRPNWPAFNKAAPFRANDEMLKARIPWRDPVRSRGHRSQSRRQSRRKRFARRADRRPRKEGGRAHLRQTTPATATRAAPRGSPCRMSGESHRDRPLGGNVMVSGYGEVVPTPP